MALKLLSRPSPEASLVSAQLIPQRPKIDRLRTKVTLTSPSSRYPADGPSQGLTVVLPLLILQTLLWLHLGLSVAKVPTGDAMLTLCLIKQSATPANADEERSQRYGRGPYWGGIGTNGCIGASGPRVPATTAKA
jgi:hypothetical protein